MTQFPYQCTRHLAETSLLFLAEKNPRYVARAGYLYIARLGHNNPFGIFYPNWAIGPNLFNSIYSVYCQLTMQNHRNVIFKTSLLIQTKSH